MDAMTVPTLVTRRLRLRPWRREDLAPFAALNADGRVMRHFPAALTREESDAFAARIAVRMARDGFGLWALEAPGVAGFIGFAGLSVPGFEAPFTPCVEIGWRLAFGAWGRGYATEAAFAALDHAFAVLKLAEVVAFTVPANRRSLAVMERLGMKRDEQGDFDHPLLPAGHPLRPHLLYRLRQGEGRRAAP